MILSQNFFILLVLPHLSFSENEDEQKNDECK